MDVNGLPMWLLASAQDFGLAPRATRASQVHALDWEADRRHLTLASQQEAPDLIEDSAMARLLTTQPSPVADGADTYAWFNPDTDTIEASGFAPGAVAIDLGPGGTPEAPPPILAPTDMALGDEQILYIARDGEVIFRDLRTRYPTARAAREDFAAHLLAPRPGGGAWAFDQTGNRLALVRGYPLRPIGLRGPSPESFTAQDPNADPPRLEPFGGSALPSGMEAVAMAATPGGRLAMLAWVADEDAAILVWDGRKFALKFRTLGVRFPWSLAWIGEDRVAILASDAARIAPQAFSYPVDLPFEESGLLPEGRTYPLREPWRGAFCNRLGSRPTYLTTASGTSAPTGIRRLLALSGVRYARKGSVLIGPIDSGQEGTVWHRMYLEAAAPGHTAMRVDVLARDSAAEPSLSEDENYLWAPHLVSARNGGSGAARAAWCPFESEIPATGALLACPPREDEAGLFTVLIQHADKAVRRVTGRYAWLQLTLEGDGRDTPELAAIRLYAKRLSYRDSYLPDFYSENLTGAEATAAGPASRPDFLERFLCLFEGNLTEIEGRIASSWMLTDPAGAPDEALPWIGSWIGISAREAERPALLRERLRAAPYTAQMHGTAGGLLAELELATGGRCIFGGQIDGDAPPERYGSLVMARGKAAGVRSLLIGQDTAGRPAILAGGAVTRGDIVVVEGFRMRRTFATILGADLADEDDPLTLGLATSGNSYVGDTLILGDKESEELLSLFSPEIERMQQDTDGVARFFEKLAHRVLVLVRNVAEPAEMRRLRAIVEDAVPAHIDPQVFAASTPLIIGAASLVGVDTFLVDEPGIERVRLSNSIVGSGDQVRGEGWLDGRADGPMQLAPTALADGPVEVWEGAPFIISGIDSHAARGRSITRYVWTWEQ